MPIHHHESPWGDQYMQSVGFTFSTPQILGCSIVLVSNSNYCATCICKFIGGGGVTGIEYLGLFLLVVEHGTSVSG